MASAGARAYNGGLAAEPPSGSRGRAPIVGDLHAAFKQLGSTGIWHLAICS